MIRILNKDFSEVEERLYSTGNEELDELMERAFCDGYEYAQKEFFDYSGMNPIDTIRLKAQRNQLAGAIKGARTSIQKSAEQTIKNALPVARMNGELKPNEKIDIKQQASGIITDKKLYGKATPFVRGMLQHGKDLIANNKKLPSHYTYGFMKRTFTSPIKKNNDLQVLSKGSEKDWLFSPANGTFTDMSKYK